MGEENGTSLSDLVRSDYEQLKGCGWVLIPPLAVVIVSNGGSSDPLLRYGSDRRAPDTIGAPSAGIEPSADITSVAIPVRSDSPCLTRTPKTAPRGVILTPDAEPSGQDCLRGNSTLSGQKLPGTAVTSVCTFFGSQSRPVVGADTLSETPAP